MGVGKLGVAGRLAVVPLPDRAGCAGATNPYGRRTALIGWWWAEFLVLNLTWAAFNALNLTWSAYSLPSLIGHRLMKE